MDRNDPRTSLIALVHSILDQERGSHAQDEVYAGYAWVAEHPEVKGEVERIVHDVRSMKARMVQNSVGELLEAVHGTER